MIELSIIFLKCQPYLFSPNFPLIYGENDTKLKFQIILPPSRRLTLKKYYEYMYIKEQ